MQTVYIDVFVFINIFEDFLLLLAVKRILRLNAKYYRIILGSAVGGLLSLTALKDLPFILNIILKLCEASFIVLVSFGYKNRKAFLKNTALLIIITFLVSGALICFYLALKPSGMAIINNTIYFNISPLLLIILTLGIYFILLLFKKIFKNHSKTELIKNVEVYYNNQHYKVKCKVDSGLNIKEPFSGSSVIIIEKSSIDNITDKTKCRIIPFKSLGGNGIIWGFKADKVVVDNKDTDEEIYIGITDKQFNSEYNGLIPINITGE